MRILAAVLLVACGNSHQAAAPDAPADTASFEFTPGCQSIAQPTDAYSKASDFGPVVPGTLAGWDPNGRWFMTSYVGGVSSYFFEKSGMQIIVDRDASAPGTIDDDTIFARQLIQSQGQSYIVAKRVSNLQPDGTLRADRAVCDGSHCNVCSSKLVRATHNNNEGEGDHITLVSQLLGANWGPGYTFNVRVLGTTAYLIRQDGLHIIDVTDPANPSELGKYARSRLVYSNDVKLVQANAKTYAIIADTPVDVVDVTNPAAPALVAQITETAHTAAVETRNGHLYAYFGNYDATCPIYDITDPTLPQKLGTYQASGSLVHDLSIDNGIAYLNAWDEGFLVVDYTNPAAPALLGKWGPTPTMTSHSNWTTTVGSRHFALHGEEAYGADLHLVDLTTMQPFVEWKTRDFISIHNLMAFGSKAYFTYYQDGVRILDLSDPTHPVQVGYYNTWDPQADYTSSDFFEGAVGLDVDLVRHLIFVADSPRGLLILHDET